MPCAYSFAARIVSRPEGGRRFASREPQRREGSGARSSPHPGEPDAGAPDGRRSLAKRRRRLARRAAGWNVVLDALPDALDLGDEVVAVGGAVDEVDLVGVDDEKRRLLVVVEVIVVRLDQLREVLGRHSLLEVARLL